jgi:hypothetical protein
MKELPTVELTGLILLQTSQLRASGTSPAGPFFIHSKASGLLAALRYENF